MITDFHTHTPCAEGICSIEPGREMLPGYKYMCAIHPWHAAEATEATLRRLNEQCASEQVVAIGETGIDRLRGGSAECQQEILMRHIEISERLGKPLVLHSVRSWEQILNLHKHINPSQPWVMHGFRLKPDVARRLAERGIYLSYGVKFNPESLRATPRHLLLLESDEAADPPYAEAARELGLSEDDLRRLVDENAARIIHLGD